MGNQLKKQTHPELSIILPCRNEEKALPYCLNQIKQVIKKHKINAEIIVSDSSTDSSPEIAKQHKVKLVKHNKEGYGNAYLEAFKHTKGKYIFMADADCTYDFNEIPVFLKFLKQDYDFVIGNRFANKIQKNSMPFSHKYIGNPLLSFILRLFFRTNIKDAHCGMRAISKQALNKLNLQTTGMEFASEMIIKAINNKLSIKQLPIKYYQRKGTSKLNTFSDGWKHLRFMFLCSPLFLFFIPGLIFFLLGFETMLWFYFTNPIILGIKFQFHPMFVSALLTIIGYQLIFFAFFAKTYSTTHLKEESPALDKLYKYLNLKTGSILGVLLDLAGLIIFIFILIKWISTDFGALNQVKNSILALTLITIGIQTIFSSFMLSILGIKEK